MNNNYHTQIPSLAPQGFAPQGSAPQFPPKNNYSNATPPIPMNMNYPSRPIQRPSDGEIELSDAEPSGRPSQPSQPSQLVQPSQPVQSNQSNLPAGAPPVCIPKPPDMPETGATHSPSQTHPNSKSQLVQKATRRERPKPLVSYSFSMEYLIIPIYLVMVFMFLVHPKTSSLFIKYVPPMKHMKGFIVRGVMLALLYLVFRGLLKLLGLMNQGEPNMAKQLKNQMPLVQ